MRLSVRLMLAAASLLLVIPVHAQLLHDVVNAEVELGPVAVQNVGKNTVWTRTADTGLVPFTGVAIELGSRAESVLVDVRFGDGSAWGEWHTAHVTSSPSGGTFLAGYHQLERIRASAFEIRVSSPSGEEITIREAGVFDNLSDSDRALPEGLVALRGKSEGHIIPPPLITRAEWGASPFQGGSPSPLSNGSYDYMTFHHAAGWSATTLAEGLAAVKSIQDFHQNGRGWSDIGYQFVIDRGGRLYQGRPFLDGSTTLEEVPALAMGAHVGGANTANIGVSLLGCYHPPEGPNCTEMITPEALQTYITLFAFLSERYGVAPTFIRGHRDFSSTACPGDNNYNLLPDIKVDVAQLLQTGNEPIGVATITATTDENGVVTVAWDVLQNEGMVSVMVERVSESGTTVVFTGNPGAGSYADAWVLAGESVSYRIYGVSADERQQRLASVQASVGLPSTHVLSEAFPNPTSDRATFRYYVPSDGFVRIDVFDASGRVVARVEDQFVDGGTWRSTNLNVSDLTSGTYFYRMTVDGFSGIVFDESRVLTIQ